jgi:hypothetical protein
MYGAGILIFGIAFPALAFIMFSAILLAICSKVK